MGRATFCTQLVPNFGYIGYIYEKWVHSWVHVTCKFPTVRVRGGGLPGTDGRPRAGGRLPDGQGGRERAAAGRTGRARAGQPGGRERATATERNGMKQMKYIHKFISINDL